MIAYAGMFENQDQADAAVAKLSEAGFDADRVLRIAGGATDELSAALGDRNKQDLLRGIESRVGDAVRAGHHLVIVKGKFYDGRAATSAMETSGAARVVTGGLDNTNHASQAFGIPLQTDKRRPNVLSNTFHMPMLTKRKGPRTSSFGLPLGSPRHITGGLLTGDKTHFMGFIPLLTPRKKRT